jgi:hypothetical protein
MCERRDYKFWDGDAARKCRKKEGRCADYFVARSLELLMEGSITYNQARNAACSKKNLLLIC